MGFASNGISNHTAGHFSECLPYKRALEEKKNVFALLKSAGISQILYIILWRYNQQILANFHRHTLGTVSFVRKSVLACVCKQGHGHRFDCASMPCSELTSILFIFMVCMSFSTHRRPRVCVRVVYLSL